MSEIALRKEGRTGRITLQRPDALNAVTHDMINRIASVLPVWAADPDVQMLVIDAEGDRAFSAGGDLMGIYSAMVAGDYAMPRQFWRDEYAMNAALFHFPKPVATFLQGFTMGGGVGVGCHGSHRIVGDSSQIAMPECGIGLAPDVGGTLLLARAPGRLGEYLGTTAYRMGPGDAILAGFADYYVPEQLWPTLIEKLEETGDWDEIDRIAVSPPDAPLATQRQKIDACFGGETLRDIVSALRADDDEFAASTLSTMGRNAPRAMAGAVELVHRARTRDTIEAALSQEYRFNHRIAEQGDFQEGIRALIVDKDRAPSWGADAIDSVSPAEVAALLMPLGEAELTWEGKT
ncbi:MAG: enoyl-CoA hydratase/isomerase family protein [Pseudomonadota bacterium]